MTIRYKCIKCGAPMSIRDDLAGKKGTCPKCKNEFIVPDPEPESADSDLDAAADSDASATEEKPASDSQTAKTPAKPEAKSESMASSESAKTKAASQSGRVKAPSHSSSKSGKKKRPAPKKEKPKEFDPADFLLGDDGGASGTPSTTPSASGFGSSPSQPASMPPAGSVSDASAKPAKKKKSKKSPPPPPAPVHANRAADRETFEESDDDRKSRLKEVYGQTSAEIAASALTSTQDSAEILLDAAVDQSRRRMAEEMEDSKEQVDYSGFVMHVGKTFVLPLIGVLVGCYLLYLGFDAMMGGGLKIPEVGRVSGVVTLDGQPLENAVVTFSPMQEEGGPRSGVRAASGSTNEQGKYTLYYTEGVRGTAVGRNRVEITAKTKEGLPMIVPGYGYGSQEFRDVKPGSQEFDFKLSSSPAAAPNK